MQQNNIVLNLLLKIKEPKCYRLAVLYTYSVATTDSFLIHSNLSINLLKPTGHVMHQQFNIQQLYVLPTLYLCVLYLSENK